MVFIFDRIVDRGGLRGEFSCARTQPDRRTLSDTRVLPDTRMLRDARTVPGTCTLPDTRTQPGTRALSAVVLAALLLSVFVCGCTSASPALNLEDDTAAATVDGVAIPESEVTASIEQMRAYYGCEDDQMWATLLSANGETPSSIRELAINSLAKNKVIESTAEAEGITVTDEEIQKQIEQTRAQYGYEDDDAWAQALSGAGFQSEDDYVKTLRLSVLQGKLYAKHVDKPTPTDEQLTAAAAKYAGAKASHILVADEDTANAIAARIESADDRAAQFAAELPATLDTGANALADANGNLGWTSIEYQTYYYTLPSCWTALSTMAVGDVKTVQEKDGYHVLMCTGVFAAPADGGAVDLTAVPSDLLDGIRNAVRETLYADACKEYLSGLTDQILHRNQRYAERTFLRRRYELGREHGHCGDIGLDLGDDRFCCCRGFRFWSRHGVRRVTAIRPPPSGIRRSGRSEWCRSTVRAMGGGTLGQGARGQVRKKGNGSLPF